MLDFMQKANWNQRPALLPKGWVAPELNFPWDFLLSQEDCHISSASEPQTMPLSSCHPKSRFPGTQPPITNVSS